MLVLSRKTGERILIGGDIAITVVRIGPRSVRIGIEAPPHVDIVREELTAAIVHLVAMPSTEGVEPCPA